MGIWEAIWKSIVLGTVQGLTEFLPVSSSGHLVLLQRLLGYKLEGGSMTFVNIMLHFGTLVAVVIAFRREIAALFKKPFKTLLMLIVATIPAGIVGVLFEEKIDGLFAGPKGLMYLAVCFAATAALLLLAEVVARSRRYTHKKERTPGWGVTTAMGLMQAVALFPGISRSGSTIAAGTVAGGKTEDVVKFSFLMSIPVILGSFVLGLKDAVLDSGMVSSMGTAGILGIVLGVVCAAVSGFFAIKLMLKVMRKADYKWFALYLVLLSFTCFWLDLAHILPA